MLRRRWDVVAFMPCRCHIFWTREVIGPCFMLPNKENRHCFLHFRRISKCTSKTSMQFSHWTKCCFFKAWLSLIIFLLQRIAGIHSRCPRGNSLWLSLWRSVLLHRPNELRQSGGNRLQLYVAQDFGCLNAILRKFLMHLWFISIWLVFCSSKGEKIFMSKWTLCCCEAPSAVLTTSTGRIILPDTTAPTLTLYECVPWRVLPNRDSQNKGNEGVAFFKAKIYFIIFHLRDRLATWIPSCDSLDMWRRRSFRYQHGNFWCTWCDFVWIRFSVARTRVILIRWLPCALRVYHLTIQIQQPRSINDLHQINILWQIFSVKIWSQVFAKDPTPQALDPPRTCLRNGDAAQHRYWRIRILEMKRVCLKASSLSRVKEKKYLKDMKRSKELHTWPTWPTWPTWSVYRYSTRISLRREEHH